MRKIKLFLALMAVSQIILAQKTIDIPVSESSGLITFEEVIDVANKTKDEIYTLGEEWIVDHFMSANSVIQMRDKENGILIGKGQHGGIKCWGTMRRILILQLKYIAKTQTCFHGYFFRLMMDN